MYMQVPEHEFNVKKWVNCLFVQRQESRFQKVHKHKLVFKDIVKALNEFMVEQSWVGLFSDESFLIQSNQHSCWIKSTKLIFKSGFYWIFNVLVNEEYNCLGYRRNNWSLFSFETMSHFSVFCFFLTFFLEVQTKSTFRYSLAFLKPRYSFFRSDVQSIWNLAMYKNCMWCHQQFNFSVHEFSMDFICIR